MGLPVLRLPSLVFGNVYRFLDGPEIIFLSQCSEKMKDVVKSHVPRGLKINVHVDKRSCEIYIPVGILRWHLRINDNPEVPVGREVIRNDGAIVHGMVGLTTRESKNKLMSVMKEEFFEEKILAIVGMLREVFNCSIGTFEYTFGHTTFPKLILLTNAFHRADEIFIYDHFYFTEELNFMLDNFVADSLVFNAYGDPEYSYQKPLNFPEIYLGSARWIDLAKLLEMAQTSWHINLNTVELISDEELNQFITWWLGSDNNTLKMVSIDREDPDDERDVDVIMEGIPSTPGRAKRREALINGVPRHNYQNGLDIRRHDGLLATVLVQESSFVLAVWHHPNPNVQIVIDNNI